MEEEKDKNILIKKSFKFTSDREVSALNIPRNWEEINTSPLMKHASVNKDGMLINNNGKAIDIGGYDIKKAIGENPECLFVKVFAIKKDEVNDNGDYFNEQELKKATKTFIGVPVFVNHQNDDIEKARGKVVHAWYDDDRGGIYTINMVDKVAFPRLARGLEAGYVTGSSMGCSVAYSCCSVCHTRAATAKEFCSHIKERKKRLFTGECECKYHDRPNSGEEPCPLCGKNKGEKKVNKFKDQKIFEHNYGVKFIEDSFVVNPACHDCLVSEILNPSELSKKVANVSDIIKKYAQETSSQEHNDGCSDGSCSLRKVSGTQEIGDLNEAMNKMERVVRSMMAQKSKVSLEYVSDIIKVCADVQKIADELVEMGYARLPSPSDDQVAYGVNSHASPITPQSDVPQMQASSMPTPSAPAPQLSSSSLPAAPQYSGSQTSDYGDDIGRVTKPSFMPRKSEYVKDFVKISHMIRDRVSILSEKIAEELALGINSDYKATDGDRSIIITTDGDGDIFITAFNGKQMIKWASIDALDPEMRMLAMNDPAEAAKRLLVSETGGFNWSNEKMINSEKNDNLKIAKRADAPEATTESQLGSTVLSYGSRQDSAPTEIGESQLDGGLKHKFVDSPSPTVRSSSPTETVESQLSGKSGFMVRWGEAPDQITESQWSSANREVYAKLPSDWTEGTKEHQLEALRQSHRWVDPSSITEDQLDKKASSSASDLLKAASAGIAKAIGFYGLSADQVKKAISIADKNSSKAVFASLYNAAPWCVEARNKNIALKRFLSKEASASDLGIDPMDAFIAGISDSIGNMKSDDVLKAASWISREPAAFSSAIEESEKYASVENVEADSEDDIFRKAFRESNFPEDGMFKICAAIDEDINVDPSSGDEFVRAVHRFASAKVAEAFGVDEVAPITIDIDDSSGVVEATVKVASMLDDEERNAYRDWMSNSGSSKENIESSVSDRRAKRASVIEKLEELEKKAQMMGGQMPGNLNPAGMGAGMNLPGGSVPPGTPGIEALTTGPGIPGPGGAPEAAADPLAGIGGDMAGDDSDGDIENANPPMAVCVVCGNNNVDVSGGKSKCKGPGCGSGFSLKVVPASMLEGAPDASDSSESSDSEVEKGLGGSGAALPAAGGMPPVAASAKLDVNSLKKIASKIEFGSVSPITGTTNTLKLGNGEWACLDSGQKYIVRIAANAKDPSSIWAQWEWVPQVKKASCSSCQRKKIAFVKALKEIGISESDFDAMSVTKKAETIIRMNNEVSSRDMKTASRQSDIRDAIKTAFTVHGKFPMNECIEKLARRYGENALALSGPCEGSNLAECVCGSLSGEKVYTTGLANKVASIWGDKDAMDNCLEDLIRSGMTLSKAAQACEGMKTKYASVEELFVESMGHDGDDGDNGGDEDPSNGDDGNGGEDKDPFDGGSDEENNDMEIVPAGNNEVDIKLHADKELLSAIEKAISDIMHGSSISDDTSDEDASDDEFDFEIDDSDDSDDSDDDGEMEDNSENSDNYEGNEIDVPENEDDMEKESDMTKLAPKSAESSEDVLHREAMALRRGRVVGVGKLELDVSKISKALSKSASDKSVDTTVPQDAVDYPSSGDGEKGMSKDTGKTDSGSGLKDVDDATVPTKGTPEFGESSKPEMANAVTGRVAAFEASLSKLAKDMKLQRGNVQDDKDLGNYSKDGIDMTAPSVPSKGGADLDVPSIPAGDGSFDGESEAGQTAEKQNHMTGGDAGSGGETKASSAYNELALKLAARMVEEKIISPIQMPAKISELSRYQVSQLQDLEKVMFRGAAKGLKTASVSGGLEKPLLIAESSSARNTASDLKSKISSLFRLHRQNEMADQTESAKLRDVFR